MDDKRFLEAFRMSKTTFEYIYSKIQHILQPAFNPLQPRESVSARKQILLALYLLGSTCEYRVAGDLFGLAKSTVSKILQKVVDAILEGLREEWIQMPDEIECRRISAINQHRFRFPNAVLSIDGSHIPITAPSIGYKDFVNRKGWPSIILQGVVDNQLRSFSLGYLRKNIRQCPFSKYDVFCIYCRFRNVNCSTPGSAHDAAVFYQSQIFRRKNEIFPQV